MKRIIDQIAKGSRNVANRISRSALERLAEMSASRKRSLNRMLFGNPKVTNEIFTPEITNTYLREVYKNITDELDYIFIDIHNYVDVDYVNGYVVDRRGQRTRLGRALVKCAKSLESEDYLSLRLLFDAVIGGEIDVTDGNKVKIAEHIAQRLGSIFNVKINGVINITTNAMDFLTAGMVDGAGSCYRPDGAHFGGCSAYAIDRDTLLVQYLDSGVLRGRFWVHVDFNNIMLLAEPVYGNVSHAIQGQVLKYIMDKLVKFMSNFMDLTGIQCAELNPYHVTMETYSLIDLDAYPGYIDFLSGKHSACRVFGAVIDKDVHNYIFELKLEEGLCLECGAIGCQSNGFCRDCNMLPTCCVCDRELEEHEQYNLNGDIYCYWCYREAEESSKSG